MTKQERKSGILAKNLVKVLLSLHSYDGDPQDVLDDAKVRLSGEDEGAAKKEAKEMVYYLECRLSDEDPYGGRA